ncbi:aspartate--tRNA ligase [Candidatus Woesearchaeota archaeon]|nr:MAG: aspartyl-tRNA synthetase [archaeon GW2011_AR4]MBS3129391.1 aspartate--tRNA ligase [Candidatus Woesearchaeota archaeon]HIH38432.1 aspartate--tRNA ligase [Candidatus Woesearchaeota archaeon]HIH48109.1 aspartate--tRNA ligase [Candidatus Woesearchaeota archaeon]HIJ03445.1 aspartate--tRNA ligase [Candidatus Woesearchaeota archaeon]
MLRTHTCGELSDKDVAVKVELCGWVNTRRDHGGVIFIDLRDKFGMTQVVFNPDKQDIFKEAEHLRREDCIKIIGVVRKRMEGMENPNLKTGAIEVFTDTLIIFSKSEVPPFEIDDRVEPSEEIRLKYRYLDLRRPIMQERLMFRHKVAMTARAYFDKNMFTEVETPLLVRATPEGARDYIVPSRVNPGKFYALPQSPQLYKQILMVAGMDRYYQMPRCLRDEDLRADRQPEHTQIDLEMSFVTAQDIQTFVEGLYKYIVKEVKGFELKEKFPVFTYKEVMDKYGIDKPDIRFGLELTNITEIVKDCGFQVFTQVASTGGMIKCINPHSEFSRNELDSLISFIQQNGGKGMAYAKVKAGKLESNIAKYFSDEVQAKIIEMAGAPEGSTLLFIADSEKKCNELCALLRTELAKRLDLINPKELKFLWVVDFPLYEWNEEENRWEPCHHMFTSPKKEHIDFLEKDPGMVLGDLFDVVLNGTEIGSGSIRISNPELQKRVMKVIGLDEAKAQEKFGFLLDAYKYGGPPHGGMGLGFDRLVALLLGLNDIREVIAFPKNKNAQCPMDGSPSDVDPEQLKETHIKVNVAKKA